MHLANLNGLAVFEEAAEEFERIFGRSHHPLQSYQVEDAEVVFVMMGSFATKAQDAVDELREAGQAVGLIRPRLLRPFPRKELRRLLGGKRGVAVIDQNLSPGMGGVLHAEVAGALYGMERAPAALASFVGGIGGRDIRPEEFYEMARVTFAAADKGVSPPPRLLYTATELEEVRQLQAIANVEREELR
jgi:pyruvate ferredoxin oxidoreductase alpha subunit